MEVEDPSVDVSSGSAVAATIQRIEKSLQLLLRDELGGGKFREQVLNPVEPVRHAIEPVRHSLELFLGEELGGGEFGDCTSVCSAASPADSSGRVSPIGSATPSTGGSARRRTAIGVPSSP